MDNNNNQSGFSYNYSAKEQAELKKIREKYKKGQSVNSLSKEYGISRWAIQSWCGLTAQSEIVPKRRGRKPAKTLQEYKYENKRLQMEVELLRDFLSLTERK